MNSVNEAKRLEELNSYRAVDSLPDKGLSDLTEVAAILSACPIAFISLIDKDKRWFISKVGFDLQQTKRNLSFCAHAIQTPQSPLIVEDTTSHPIFKDNPSVFGKKKIRFYAGFPLVTESGFAIGTLCVKDTVPRKLSQNQITALKALASQAVVNLECKRAKFSLLQLRSKRLARSEFSFLGQLTGGIAHEINNPLSIILCKTASLKRLRISVANFQEIVESIEATAWRISKIIQSLTDFSHGPEHFHPERTSLKEVIELTMLLCGGKIKSKGINFEIEAPENDIELYIDKQKIKQSLLNLLFNSIDAVKNLDDKWIKLIVDEDDEFVSFSVVDSGTVDSKEIQDQMFSPFFSTKPIGDGAGLGLSECMGIAKAHGGCVFFDDSSKNTKIVFKVKKPSLQRC